MSNQNYQNNHQNQNYYPRKKQKNYPKVDWRMIPPYITSWDGKVFQIVPLSEDGNRCDFVEITDFSKLSVDPQEYLQMFGPRKFKIKAGGYEGNAKGTKDEE